MLGVAIMPWIGSPGMAGDDVDSALGRWVAFLGLFHPLVLHVPIGAVLVVFVIELAGLVTLGKYRNGTTLALFVAAGSAIVAVVLGYFQYLAGGFSGDLVEVHKRDGIIFTLLLIATFLVKYSADVLVLKKFLKPLYVVCLLGTLVMMIRAGHHGGKMTHGDPLDDAPWKGERSEVKPVPVEEGPVVFETIVLPILDEKCSKCHGAEKQRSDFRCDSYAAILAGGELQADGDGKVLVPGKTEESTLISYLLLPLDDDLRMPPEGKKQLSEDEIKILSWWVASGASETAKLSELEMTSAVSAALEALK